ncbi:MAG: sulfotransferase [Lentisphaerae bacterium]|nr:sulfotransferase [Lentisphaerota bacterium]
MQRRLCLVTGRGRSGTWLLSAILNYHPGICIAPEAEFAAMLYGRYGSERRWRDATLRRFCCDLFRIPRMQKWLKMEQEAVEARLLEGGERLRSYEAVCAAVYACYADRMHKAGADVIGEKNPPYTLCLDRLLASMPSARVIYMVRDPRDVVLSFQNVVFDLNSAAALAYRWRYYNRKGLEAVSRYRDRCLLLRFEDLLSQPETELRRICEFLSVPYSDGLLRFYEDPQHVRDWNVKITEPLDAGRAYGWKRSSKRDDLAIVNRICGAYACTLGYEEGESEGDGGGWCRERLGLVTGAAATLAERLLYRLPLRLQIAILYRYRTWD